jgi:1-acyl-sn-glycerol-3-phosphate acyltransferase
MWLLTTWSMVTAVSLYRWWRSGQTLAIFLGLGVVRAYTRLWHGYSSNGCPHLPVKGPAILLANHTCSADPAFLTTGCARPLSFLIAREFYLLPMLRALFDYIHCVPVTRNGTDVLAVRTALRRLRDGRVLCIFPEGDLSNAGRPQPRPGKAGVALLALRSQAPVIPAWIEGGPQTWDVTTAWLRPSRRRVRVVFGPAVDLAAYYDRPINRKLLEEVTALLMGHVAALRHRPRRPCPERNGHASRNSP